MAKITSRAQLNDGTEIIVDTAAKTVRLVATGNLVAKDGVTLQAVYSKLVDLWNTATYNDYDFPMYAKDALSGEYVIGYNGTTYNGWTWFGVTLTRSYLRDGGWSEYNSSGVLQKQYVGIVSLGTLNSSGIQTYYQSTSGGTATNFTYTDAPNEGIKVYDVSVPLDTRTYFKAYARQYAYTYSESTLADTGLTGTGAFKVNVLLSNITDAKIQAADATVAASTPYTGITVTWLAGTGFANASAKAYVLNEVGKDATGRWFRCSVAGTLNAAGVANYTLNGGSGTFVSYSGERLIGSTYYAFNIIVNGNSATKEQIYTKIQYLLRQATDIDAASGGHTGKITASLMAFAGDTLTTTTGVYIDSYLVADKNNLQFTDVGGTVRTNPFAVQGTFTFNSYLTSGGTGKYRMYFTTNPAGNYGTSTAVTVNDASGSPITGTITGSSVSFTYDYDGNVQGGRTAATDAAVTVVAVNPGSSKVVVATATLTRTSTASISVTADQDLGYVAATAVTYTFTGSAKTIGLSAGTVSFSTKDAWSRWIDWMALSDNSKYLPAWTSIGGNTIDSGAGTSIPLYDYLSNGWKIKPDEVSHTLKVTGGVLLTDDGSEPINATVGAYTVRVIYQQPVQAIGVTSASSLSAQDLTDIRLTNLLVKDGLS